MGNEKRSLAPKDWTRLLVILNFHFTKVFLFHESEVVRFYKHVSDCFAI